MIKLDKKSVFYHLLSLVILWGHPFDALTQETDRVLDPAGYVNKYDTAFNGIGPRVYILPAPRTREELLMDSYADNTNFRDSIDRALDLQRLIADFKSTHNEKHVKNYFSPLPNNVQGWAARIENESRLGRDNTAYGLLHLQAEIELKKGEIHQAITLLQRALQHAQKTPRSLDVPIIQYNLANVYLYDKKIEQAGYFQEAFYRSAVAQKSHIDQANALVKIALIQAHDKDYRSAENNIIRKAIPLLNRAKAYEQKTAAWRTLAKIYQLQNKHTEAQWFLIQARDLARKNNFADELAEIEYMLAFSKFIQKNYGVAKKEFLQADELAKSEDNKLLQLAILDKLGQIYMTQSDFNNAEAALVSYQDLRNVLFRDHTLTVGESSF